LLSEQISRERIGLIHGRRDVVREGQNHVGYIRRCEFLADLFVTTDSKDIVGRQTIGLLTEGVVEDLVARKEILGGTTITERHLLDEAIAPTTRESKTRGIYARNSSRSERADNILETVVGRNCENRGTARKIGELLNILGVLCRRKRLFLRGVSVVVINIHHGARAHHVLNTRRTCHTIPCFKILFFLSRMPKFINATLVSRRAPSDKSHHPFGKRVPPVAPSPNAEPPKWNPEVALKNLLKTMEPEPSQKLKGRLMSLSATPAPDRVQKEVSDILDILRNVNKK
jgi:hypothetical protein